MQVILVYEMPPEKTQVYALDVSSEDLIKLRKCHDNFANLVGTSDDVEDLLCDWLPVFLKQYTPFFDSDGKQRNLPHTYNGEIEIIVSGYVL